jgi:DNA replication and repair protein RecF
MVIESIELKNYRNYECEKISLDEGLNILYGDNAQGKTNILESIYLCATTKSHRGSRDKDIIRFNQDESHIKLLLLKNNITNRIDIHLKKDKKKGIAINGIPIKKISELFGIINVVIFSPEDLDIIKRGPDERRRFIDLELCQIDSMYVHNLINYNKIILHRNKLLKDCNDEEELNDMLGILDIQLADYGAKIINRREEFIDKINEIILNIHKDITNQKETLKIAYEPGSDSKGLYKKILENREKDIRYKYTTIGPHRDDIGFYVNDLEMKKYGSQGQQRTCALSLKLSEIDLIRNITGDTPVLLLDDVLSELDSVRQVQLLRYLNNVQTVITCTGLDDFINNGFDFKKIYKIIEGKIIEKKPGESFGKEI